MIASRNLSSFVSRWGWGWLPLWGYSVFVVWSAALPPSDIPGFLAGVNDKLIHAVEYLLLCLAAVNAFERAKAAWFRERILFKAFFYSLILGAVTESIQLYAPGRTCDVYDWLADGAGAGAAIVLWVLFSGRIRGRMYSH